jgi:hypothetical protein
MHLQLHCGWYADAGSNSRTAMKLQKVPQLLHLLLAKALTGFAAAAVGCQHGGPYCQLHNALQLPHSCSCQLHQTQPLPQPPIPYAHVPKAALQHRTQPAAAAQHTAAADCC